MAISGAKIPVSNKYATALAPNITLPGVSLTGMPESVSLLTESIPQIDPTGMLDFTPISIDESKWVIPRAGADITGAVKKYYEEKNKKEKINPVISGRGGDVHTGSPYYKGHLDAAKKAGVSGIKAFFDGSHKAWVEKNKELMAKHGITLTHKDSKGNLTGKYSSDDWAALQRKL